jgi:hypothetical protein
VTLPPSVRSNTLKDRPGIRVKTGRLIGRDSLDSRPVISVVVRVRIGRLPSSVPAGLRRRNARRRQHHSRCENSDDLASHFVLHSVAKLSGPLSGRTDQSNCLRFIIPNVRMGTFDYSGNPEKPIQAHRTIQAEGNKLRWITPFRRHKPTETHADPARGAALRFRQGAAAISGRTAHPRLGPAHRGKLERPSWRNQIIVWRRIGSIGRDRFSRTVAGGGKVSPSLRAPARSLPVTAAGPALSVPGFRR